MLQAQIDAQKEKAFQHFMEKDAPVFIVDKNPSSRRRLAQVVIDMGVKSINVHRFADLDEAEKILNTIMPRIVITDFSVGKYSGFDFFQSVREKKPESNSSVFLIVTSNISQSAVAKAAEEDVDAYIIKPFTTKGITSCILDAVMSKVQPSEYITTIEQGKELLFAGQFQEALDIFAKATKMNPKPTLAHFYYGQAESFLQNSQDAQDSYKTGLQFNKIHFKCQSGLLEIFMKEKKYEDAYGILKTLTEYFPPNPERLALTIRLAVVTKNFTDITMYYDQFQNLEKRTSETVKHVCAGLFVLGKFYTSQNQITMALTTFDKLTTSCAGDPKFVYPVIEILGELELYHEIQKHFARLSPTVLTTEQLEICNYLISASVSSGDVLMTKGLELYNRGIKHFLAFKIFVQSTIDANFPDRAMPFIQEAKVFWPGKGATWGRLELEAKKKTKDLASKTSQSGNAA